MSALRQRETFDLGVLFVHGIGNQTQGSTLAEFGTPLVEWTRSRAKDAGIRTEVAHTVLTGPNDEPAFSELTFFSKSPRRWLLAESWWAQSFPLAQFRDVATWSLLIVPWTLGTHFGKRMRRVWKSGRPGRRIAAVSALVGALLVSPLVLLVLAVLLALGTIPWPQLRAVVAKIQLSIASSLGDSFMLVTRPLEAAAIRSRLRRDVNWMLRRCRRVAVVAHSQGGAVACQVLSTGRATDALLITFGSGLRKLEELDEVRQRKGLLEGALAAVLGLFVASLALLYAPLMAYQVLQGTASPTSAVVLLALALGGVVIGVSGLQDFFHAREPFKLTPMTVDLYARGVRWEDVYSSVDPVSNGPVRDDPNQPPNSTEVVNLGSALRDHTAYWQNRDEFVALVVEKLLAFDGATLLPPMAAEATTFLRRQRAIRVRVRRALGWATTLCVVVLLVRYRWEWLAVAAWGSHNALAWLGNLIGVESQAITIPDAGVWRRSVGWLSAVLVASWLARVLWALWDHGAMDDAERGLYRTQEPVGVLLVLFVELLLTAVAAVTFSGWTFALAGLGVLIPLIAVAIAQGRSRPPKVLQTATPEPSTSSAIVAWRALVDLGFVGIVIVGVPWYFFDAAMAAQRYVALRFGTGWSWGVAVIVLLVGAVVSFATIGRTQDQQRIWRKCRCRSTHRFSLRCV